MGSSRPLVARRHAEVVAHQRASFVSQTTFDRRLASAVDALEGGSSVAVAVIELDRVTTESTLHRALGRGELFVRYQPIVDMSSSSTVSLEALVRWRHPELGVVGPERFIPIAEDTGLIVPIGAWVLEEACRQLARWWAGPWPALDSVTVNLSARQIEDPEVVELVRRVMACTRLSGRSLVCEITESTLMRDAEASLGVLRALKAAGVALAVDDFGTGYSSLSCLRHLPVDILKIDKCFVQCIDEGESTKIVAAMVNLGHELGMVVAAEGVETAAQAQVIRALGCDLVQGMWCSSPLDASEVPMSGTTGSQLARNEPRRVSLDT